MALCGDAWGEVLFRSRPLRLTVSALICALAAPLSLSAAPPVLRTKSEIRGVSLVALGKLPHSPENGSLDEYCEGYRAKRLTAAGRQVASRGWIVTSDGMLGPYEVVTFASGFTPGTSAMCFARNSNVAVFNGTNLVALAYSSRAATSPLGVVEPLESGALLVWTDPPGWPIGELRDQTDGLHLAAIASERTFCNRRAVVPNVYGKPIDAARQLLIAHGWRPLRPREAPNEMDMARQLAQHGVVEVETCSGTGVGYCSFNYRGPVGTLSVTSAGEDPRVVSYRVTCPAP